MGGAQTKDKEEKNYGEIHIELVDGIGLVAG